MNAPMIVCQSLSKHFDTVRAVSDISFEINESEFISILGPSGCGKSTLLRLVAGLEIPDQGSVRLHGEEISSPAYLLPPEKRRFGMVFQDFALFPHLNVAANIAYGVRGSRSEKRRRVGELLELVNLPHLARQMPHQLSGGEQQRIAVARSLAPRPRLILMDEPFSNLDYQLRVQLRRDIREILRHEGVATVLVTHDQHEAITFSERMLLMQEGTLVQEGTPAEIYRHPRTSWAANFVGEANVLPAAEKNGRLHSPLGPLEVSDETAGMVNTVMVRPEELTLLPPQSGRPCGKVTSIEFAGPVQLLTVSLASGESLRVSAGPHRHWTEGEPVSLLPERFICFNSREERVE